MNSQQFGSAYRRWLFMNSLLVLDMELPEKIRYELLRDRVIYSKLFSAMEGCINDKHSK